MKRETLEQAIDRLEAGKERWARLPLSEKIKHIDELRRRTRQHAQRWVNTVAAAKGIPAGSPLAGEEWMGGPWALLHALYGFRASLVALHQGRELSSLVGPTRRRQNGQLVVDVFPSNLYDRLLLNGVRAEVWMEPGVTEENLSSHMGNFYQKEEPEGALVLILGAGNVASITPLDALTKLFGEGKVALVKMNPVNDYLGPILSQIFEIMSSYGFIEFVYGGAEVGSFLTRHEGIDEVHMTGSVATHDAIVYGTGEEGARRKAADEPLLSKPMTSELGNVTPTLVVPSPWDEDDLRFQAEHVATQKMNNGGFNCIGSQILLLPKGWPLLDRFLFHLRTVLRSLPMRNAYYPGAEERLEAGIAAHPEQAERLDGDTMETTRALIHNIDPESQSPLFDGESFCGLLGLVYLPDQRPHHFMQNAVRFCNERLVGSLGANLIIHPRTRSDYGQAFERTLEELKYGSIGVNIWSGSGYMLSQTPWGAFPGERRNQIESGIGKVHNHFLFDRPQKSVVIGNFSRFPRSLMQGEPHILPGPPWFVTHREAHRVGKGLVHFAAAPHWLRLPSIFWHALRG